MSKTKIIKKDQTISIRRSKNVIAVAPNRRVNIIVQASGELTVAVGSNAFVHIVSLVKQAKERTNTIEVRLVGAGAAALVSGIFHGQGKDRHSCTVTMRHTTDHTKGDILIRGVYENNSHGSFTGMIKIDKSGRQTNSYFTDNILLFDEAVVTSVPNLEIEANEVKASHSSTTSRIDREQLFYLTSRGLDQARAKQMIINGFFEPVLRRFLPEVRERANRPTTQKLRTVRARLK